MRAKAFVVDTALDQAMRTFWRRGYQGTSVRDLCEEMAIGSASFYATFGSKAELFRLALARYLRSFDLGPPAPAAIAAWFHAVVADREPTGCLLVGSAVEVEGLEPDARLLVGQGLTALEDFFWACLEGRPHARRDARALGAALAGIHVLHRAGMDRARLRETADRILSALDIPLPTA